MSVNEEEKLRTFANRSIPPSSTIGVAQTHTAEANAIKAINLIVEAMLFRMIKTRTTNYETGFYVTEVRQLSC